jgi:hypothetical protein
VAANVSRSKQVARIEDKARAEAMGWLVPGWTVELTPPFRIREVPTLAGAQLRGQVLLFRCRRSGCGRRVQPDLEELTRGGFGHLSTGELGAQLTCSHPLGCRLSLFSETYPDGVPLIAYVQQPEILIAVRCKGCGHAVTGTAADTITRLRRARRGDGSTGVLALASRVRGPCRKCGERVFEVEVIRPAAYGAGR